jgi:uncharacterized protein (DUF1684 family)
MKLNHLFLRIVAFAFTIFVITTTRAAGQQPTTDTLTYEDELNAWHARRLAGLKRPQGWLSLVALDWLQEGRNTIESVGTITLDGESLALDVLPAVKATVRGKEFTSGLLQAERDRVEIGSRAFTIIKRGDRFALRMWDSTAQTLQSFTGIERFPISRRWRIEARWEPYAKPKPIKVASVIPGFLEDYNVPGIAIFSIEGKECKLEPVEAGGNSLFFIFADQSNGADTYAAGRFLYTEMPKDGKLVIDFNKAVNPPCAFTPFATCPLPPESNHLAVRIEAGEKKFGDH